MGVVFELREEYIKSIEKKAFEKLRAFPIDETGRVYAIPTNATNTFNIDEAFKKAMFLRDNEVIEAIKNFKINFRDNIVVAVNDWDEEENMTLFLTNGPNPSPGSLNITVHSEIDHDDREMIINMIAYYQKHNEVTVIFLINYPFEQIEEMVKSDEDYYVPELLR